MNEQPNPLGLAMPSTRVSREPLDASSSSSWFPSHVNILFVVWFSLVLLFHLPNPERQKSIGNFSASSAAGIPPIIVCLSQVLHCLMSDLFAFGLWSMQLINFTYPLAHTHTHTHTHIRHIYICAKCYLTGETGWKTTFPKSKYPKFWGQSLPLWQLTYVKLISWVRQLNPNLFRFVPLFPRGDWGMQIIWLCDLCHNIYSELMKMKEICGWQMQTQSAEHFALH